MHEPVRILVVDDDPQIVKGLLLRLKSGGFDVVGARDGEQGLQSLSEFEPDFVIIDVRMPKMDGLEMLAELRKRGSDRNCWKIVLSANTPEETRSEAISLGADHFMKKPFQYQALDRLIRSKIKEFAHAKA